MAEHRGGKEGAPCKGSTDPFAHEFGRETKPIEVEGRVMRRWECDNCGDTFMDEEIPEAYWDEEDGD